MKTRISLVQTIVILCFISLGLNLKGQFNPAWQFKKAAVVLTYDDGVAEQLIHAVPVLDSLGLKGTFYLTGAFDGARNHLAEWKKVGETGHELGNHTLFHPCTGGPGREWVQGENDLRNYTVARMVNEMKMTNIWLETMDGKKDRTFAFTCGDMKIGDQTFIDKIPGEFVGARAVRHEMHKINEVDLMNIDCYAVNGESFETMKSWVDEAISKNALLVFLFHGVGGGHNINVDANEHRKLLQYIKSKQADLMVAPMVDVAQHIKDWQSRDAAAKKQKEDTQNDHQGMMAQLKITSLRPGPSGDPSAPNAANSDESKASPYTSLPDPLIFKNGKKVKSARQWEKRKVEIAEDFDREIYGRTPKVTPGVDWKVTYQADTVLYGVPAIYKELNGRVDNATYPEIEVNIQMNMATPKTGKPVPLITEFGFVLPRGMSFPGGGPSSNEKPWQQQLLEKGWGYAVLVPTSYQADNGAGLTKGIIGLVNKGKSRKPEDWGTLKAWAWGASRAIDYFETDKDVDATKLGIEGLSRYGKATAVAMAYEPRFKVAFIGSSGAGGVKILRRQFGEQVENLASSAEYHWFAGNFIKYAGPLTPKDMPVDCHELVALCAPRPVFISVGAPNVEGQWIDAKGCFLGGVHAGPVYKLLGKKGLGQSEFPAIGTNLADGEVAFRQHFGGHTTGPNWPFFIDWASKYLE